MPTIKRFEELRIWQDARKQCQQITMLIQNSALKDDHVLRNQMERSSGSVMDNIAEGFDRFTKKDFRHFLMIARGSNAELRSQLYRVSDKGYNTKGKIDELICFSEMLSVKISAFIRYLNNSGYNNKPNTSFVNEDDVTFPEAPLEIPQTMNKH